MKKQTPTMKGTRKNGKKKEVTFIGALSATGMNQVPPGRKGGKRTVKKW